MILLVDITPENHNECVSLSVAPEQKGFEAANRDSLAEASVEAGFHPVGISNDGQLVGFAMYGYHSDEDQSWIVRFMIDAAHQRQGYGVDALGQLIQLLSTKYPESAIRLCVEPENEVAIRFYRHHGFQPTGAQWGNEMIFERKACGY